MQSPLHVAVKKGHLEFVKKILSLKPELAEVVDQIKRSTPLHIAAATKGPLKIVDELLQVRPNMCFVQDQDGLTPLHVAAVNGNTDVLQTLLKKKRQAALERTTRGETILHLCVKNSYVETLKALLVKDTCDLELLNSEDSDGNTVLHLAVTYKETEMVKLLLEQGDKMNKNAMNKKGKTVKDIFNLTKVSANQEAIDREPHQGNVLKHCLDTILGRKGNEECTLIESDKEIEILLKDHRTLRAKKVQKESKDEKWFEEQNTALMVVASCIATISFQVGINPPGGFWQDDEGHVPGTSIMSYDKGKDSYNIVQVSNTIGLISSLSVILLLISGLPCKRYFVSVLRVMLWIAVTASATTYFYTIGFVTSDFSDETAMLQDALDYSVEIWLFLMLIVLLGHGLRLIRKLIGYNQRIKIRKGLKKLKIYYPINNV